MKPAGYEFQSDFARRFVAQGKEEGRLEGRAGLVMRLLAVRFGPLAEDVRVQIARASISDLDAIGERLLTARTLQEALGLHGPT